LLADQLGTAPLGRATWFIAELGAVHGHYAEFEKTGGIAPCDAGIFFRASSGLVEPAAKSGWVFALGL